MCVGKRVSSACENEEEVRSEEREVKKEKKKIEENGNVSTSH